jgi:hypothetical protein
MPSAIMTVEDLAEVWMALSPHFEECGMKFL